MKSHLIGYDLRKSGQDYTTLIEQIKLLGIWWHCLDSTWIVKSDLSAVQIGNTLSPFIDANDLLLVVELTGEAAWTASFSKECQDWLSDNLEIN